MRNYVIMYNVSDDKSEKELMRQLHLKFPKNKIVKENGFNYFSFAERKLPGVQDSIQEIMDSLRLDETDYIALFYTREEDPDLIHRLMVFGTSNLFENDLKKVSRTIHERSLSEFLELNLINR